MSPDAERAQQSNPFLHIRQKNNRQWYLYWLCEDDEFKGRHEKYSEYFDINWKSFEFEGEEAKLIVAYGAKLYDDILRDFGISEGEFDAISTGLHLQFPFDFPFEIGVNDEEGSISVRIPAGTKRKEYMGAWVVISELLERPKFIKPQSQTRRRIRAADDTQLIYAVHKQRLRGETFSAIYRMYQEGSLSAYLDRPTNQFVSQDVFEEYYRRNKPSHKEAT